MCLFPLSKWGHLYHFSRFHVTWSLFFSFWLISLPYWGGKVHTEPVLPLDPTWPLCLAASCPPATPSNSRVWSAAPDQLHPGQAHKLLLSRIWTTSSPTMSGPLSSLCLPGVWGFFRAWATHLLARSCKKPFSAQKEKVKKKKHKNLCFLKALPQP